MDPYAISLIQTSFSQVRPQKEAFAEHFYDDLFATSPEVKDYFDGVDMRQQGDKLMAALHLVVKGLNNLEALVPLVEDMAIRHVGYGVQPDDYDKVGASLLRTFARTLDEGFTQEAEMAWSEAYDTLATVMKVAAYPAGGRGFTTAPTSDKKPFWKFWS
jgi:nitric oxide dioxygenase